MDQSSLPPLPSLEDLFAPSTKQSSSVPFLKNVNLFVPVPPLPPSPTTDMPPMPPQPPCLEFTEPGSPIPPQPTSPLVDRFDFEFEGIKTNDSTFQPEKSKSVDSSSQELPQGSPPSKKVRFSETAEVASSVQYDSREEGEISDDTDDDVHAVTSSKFTSLNHKLPSSSHPVHHNEQTLQSASHRRVPADCSQNTTKTLLSSVIYHQSHASDVTGKSLHRRHQRAHHSHHSSKDASKSSHRHHHQVDGAGAHKTERSSSSQKKPAADGDGQKQPDDSKRNKHTSKSSIRRHSSSDRAADRESAKSKSWPSSSSDGLIVDTRKSSVDMDAPYSPGSLDLDQLFDPGLVCDLPEVVSRDDSTSSKIDTLNASVPCLGLASNAAQNREITSMNGFGDSTTCSILTATNVENRLPGSDLAFDLQEAVSCDDKTRSKVDTVSAGMLCLGPLSNAAQNREITNADIGESTARSVVAAVNVEDRLLNYDLAFDLQEVVSRSDIVTSKIDAVNASVLCLGVVSTTAQHREVTDVSVGDTTSTSVLAAMNIEDPVVEIDTSDQVEELPAAEETELTAESAAVDGVGQEYDIIDDLQSNSDEMNEDAGASSDNSDVEFNSGDDGPPPVKHVKTQHRQRFKETAGASEQTLNDLEPFDKDRDDNFQAPIVRNKLVLHGESEKNVFSVSDMLLFLLLALTQYSPYSDNSTRAGTELVFRKCVPRSQLPCMGTP